MSGSIPGLFASFAAGLLSFASPCVLPLIPVYLSFISGESAEIYSRGETRNATHGASRRFPLFLRTVFFVFGFMLVFALLAVVFSGGMSLAGIGAKRLVGRVAGALVIVLAFNTWFDFIPFLRQESRPGMEKFSRGDTKRDSSPRSGSALSLLRPVLLGMAFAAGWTPCIGPILSGIVMYAAQAENAARAALLLAVYAAGLGVPFLLAALFLDRLLPLFGVLKRHAVLVKAVSAILLLVLGLAMITDGLL